MIIFTEAAIKKLKNSVESTDYVRVGVSKGGCAGLSYTMEVVEGCNSDDFILTLEGVNICMDPYSKFVLRETTVDYVESLHQSAFKFKNSKATKSCGCGTSFKPDDEEVEAIAPPGCATAGCGT